LAELSLVTIPGMDDLVRFRAQKAMILCHTIHRLALGHTQSPIQ